MMKLFLLSLTIALALNAQPRTTFEAVSIRVHPEPIYVSNSSTSGTIAVWAAGTIRDLIVEGWNLKYYQVPEIARSIGSTHFDITARAPGSAPVAKEEFRAMIRTMLAERFHLKGHLESKEMPVYALVIAKSGHKLKEADMNGRMGGTMASGNRVRISSSQGAIKALADQLSNSAGRPVIDTTGLTGLYSYALEFNPSTNESDLPPLSTALEDQLGLRFEPRKAPVEIFTVESVEQPSEN
jgi:uncharacterized protein (TIGR03435 family)